MDSDSHYWRVSEYEDASGKAIDWAFQHSLYDDRAHSSNSRTLIARAVPGENGLVSLDALAGGPDGFVKEVVSFLERAGLRIDS